MITAQADRKITLQSTFGIVAPPEKITQEAFDHEDGHLRRLVRMRPGERAQADDLWKYTQDLRYTEIQGPLFAYLLPFCLEAWREDLRGIHEAYGGFIEHFYPVLADRRVFERYLTLKQSLAVSQFMRQAILEEIDDQRGLAHKGMRARPYRWIRALTTYGVLFPAMDRLWTAWWSCNTVGRVIAVVQYVSCLMYPESANPVFAPWTPDEGGGPPCLWEFHPHLYTHRWLEPNVNFLKGILNVRSVSDLLVRAVERLLNQPEHDVAARIQEDFPLYIATLEARCAELPLLLETTQQPAKPLSWST